MASSKATRWSQEEETLLAECFVIFTRITKSEITKISYHFGIGYIGVQQSAPTKRDKDILTE